MKFTETFRTIQVPEWSSKYFHYGSIKRDLMTALRNVPTAVMSRHSIKVVCDCDRIGELRPTAVVGVFVNPDTGLEEEIKLCIDGSDDMSDADTSRVEGFAVDVEMAPLEEHDTCEKVATMCGAKAILLDVYQRICKVNESYAKCMTQELHKINNFYRVKAEQFSNRAAECMNEAKMVGKMSKAERKTLVESMEQVFYALDLLSSYCTYNYIAISKMMKKFEKTTRQSVREPYMRYVASHEFHMPEEGNAIERLKNLVLEEYSKRLHDGDVKRSANALRVKRNMERSAEDQQTSVHVGMCYGALAVLGVTLAYQYYYYYDAVMSRNAQDNLNASYIFSMAAMGILLSVLFALNVLGWDHYSINYTFIFELDPRNHFNGLTLMRDTMIYAIVLFLGMHAYVSVSSLEAQGRSPFLPSWITPHLMIMSCAFVWMVSNIIRPRQRRWFWLTLVRILKAPLVAVRFSDFFLADQLTSLTSTFFELQFAICVWNNIPVGEMCAMQRRWKWPIFILLPGWWRLMQCIRRYRDMDTRTFHPHLNNAVKYLSGMANVLGSVFFTYQVESGGSHTVGFVVWFMMAYWETVHKLYWDFFVDWGLIQEGCKEVLLRDQLRYPKWCYYFALTTNLFARHAWVIRHLTLTHRGVSLQYWEFLLFSAIEVLRRFQWNFFRLENEQQSNCESFRAVTLTPPPFYNQSCDVLGSFEEDEAAIQTRLSIAPNGGEKSEGADHEVLPQDNSKLTVFFAQLPEAEKVRALTFYNPSVHFEAKKNSGKTAYFSRLHAEDKVRIMHLALGDMTMQEYVAKVCHSPPLSPQH